jgi:EF hand
MRQEGRALTASTVKDVSRRRIWIVVLITLSIGLAAVAAIALSRKRIHRTNTVDEIVSRMMGFDKNKDGKLSRDEITDSRMERLFDRADVNQDRVVTREELVALGTKMIAEDGNN